MKPVTKTAEYARLTPAHIEGHCRWRLCEEHDLYEVRANALVYVDGMTFDQALAAFQNAAERQKMCSPMLEQPDEELLVVGWVLPRLEDVRTALNAYDRIVEQRLERDEREFTRLRKERPDLFQGSA